MVGFSPPCFNVDISIADLLEDRFYYELLFIIALDGLCFIIRLFYVELCCVETLLLDGYCVGVCGRLGAEPGLYCSYC